MRELKRDQKLLDELEGLDDSERSQATARLAEEQRKVAARLCLCVALDCKSKEAMQAQIKIALAAGLESEGGLEEAMQALQRKESLERKAMSAAPSHPDPRAQGVSEAQGVSRACTCDGPLEPPTPEPPAPARPTGRWGSLRRSVPVAPRPPDGASVDRAGRACSAAERAGRACSAASSPSGRAASVEADAPCLYGTS